MKTYLVLDFGGTYTKYALMDEQGAFLNQGKVPSACESLEQMLASVAPLKDQFSGQYNGVAVSMPGRIDTHNGIAHTGGSFTFISNTPIQAKLEQLFDAPVTIANDGKCAASAEAWNGALSDVEDGVVIVLGTGTGGGVVLNHRVRMGKTFGAGELSAFAVNLDALANGISYLGDNPGAIWADYMSATGLLTLYGKEKGLPGMVPGMDGIAFFEEYDRGDADAIAALISFGRYAAAGIYSIQAVLDVERVAIGGGISARHEIVDTIREAVDRQFASIPFTPFGKPEIVQCRHGNDANLIGALAIHLNCN